MEKGYKNLGFILLMLIPLTVFGFYKTYLGEFPKFENNPGTAIHFHFLISGIWILLFILQPLLIYYRKTNLHKLVGKSSYIFFFLLLISFVPLYIIQLGYGFLPLIVLTTSDIILMISLYALAIYYRKNAGIHMRYMISLVLVFALPSIGRINSRWLEYSFIENMNIGFGFVLLFLIALIFKDKRSNNNFRPYLIALSGFTIRQLAIFFAYYFN